MRVIASSPAVIRPEIRRARAMNLELAGLAAVSLVVVLGLLLTTVAKDARVDEPLLQSSGATGATAVLRLDAIQTPAELEPVLDMFTSAPERTAVAQAVHRYVSGASALEHVGGLAAVTLPAAEVRAQPSYTRLRERLDRRPGADTVPAFSAADIAAIKPLLAVRTLAQYRVRTLAATGLLLAAFWAAHLVRRWRRRDDDPVLLPAMLLLCGLGAMAMTGMRDPVRDTMAIVTFAGGVAGGLLALLLAAEVDFEASRLRRAVILPLAAALGLALLLLLFGSGPGASGVKVNLFGAQPVEVIRLLVVFALAAYFGRRLELLRALSEPATPERRWLRYFRMPRWKDVRPVFASMALVLLFFFFQKDLGPALVLTCVFLGLYGLSRGHAAFVLTGVALLVTAFAAAYWIGEPSTVRQRVAIWSNPWNNGVPGGNQIAHGLWALSTGGAWGSGPGLGTPEVIPAGHTDFVLAAIGEELGFAGVLSVLLLYALLAWRCLRAALRAPGDYSSLLAAGVALSLVIQGIVIGGGLLGLVPLSGVVTPFLSFGRSSMLANCVAVGIVLAIAQRRSRPRAHMRRPLRVAGGVLAAVGLVIAARVAWVQVVRADDFAAAASVSEQADGGYRFEHNPRLLRAARTLTRGTIYDRNGLPLATSRADEMGALAAAYKAAGSAVVQPCDAAQSRCYPLGGLAFHLLGDWNEQTNWAARNSSYVERDSESQLKGYDDHAAPVQVVNPRTGQTHDAIARDYRELLPLIRQRYWLRSSAIDALRARTRDVHTTIDARLQVRAAAALRERIEAGGHEHGAVVVVDAASGDVLASVSYPWPDLAAGTPGADERTAVERRLDRARYGLYPPGSVFKLVLAGAALRSADRSTFGCMRLPDGRNGHAIRGSSRPVRDDPMDTVPHGDVDLHKGLVVSCNAYFAQLAQRLGPRPVFDAASLFQIDVARAAGAEGLRPTLPHAGYGQGQVLASPLKMARVSASIAAGGVVPPVRWFQAAAGDAAKRPADASASARFLSASQAAQVGRAMREVVTHGNGRALRGHPVSIAGKTGTAEVSEAAAHSWFTGFAPYGNAPQKIAFAVLIEHAGYGARAAAPVAGELVTAARDIGLIK
jgi:cell division protein FtsW (lipid II flippase)/cell division protein FtsI/penicillin-binding protein 2